MLLLGVTHGHRAVSLCTLKWELRRADVLASHFGDGSVVTLHAVVRPAAAGRTAGVAAHVCLVLKKYSV